MELTLSTVRQAALLCAALAVIAALINARRVLRATREYFLEPGSALGLALMRVTIFWMLLQHSDPEGIARNATLPEALRHLPPGWGWLAPVLPFDGASAHAITQLFAVASALALLGLFTGVAAPIAALLGLYVLGMPNFFGKIDHGAHATELCALILAASPCGDALSLDRVWRRYCGHEPPALSAAYTLPLRFCFLILGTVYLFPGLWKLWMAGDLWISGVQLPAMLRSQWAHEYDFTPAFRPDESPWLMQALGIGTLLFEIGFSFMLWNRWTRIVAAFSAVAFHLSVLLLMGIHFHVLLPLVLLYDLPGLPNALAARLPKLTAPLVRAGAALRARGEAWLARGFGPLAQPRIGVSRIWLPAALVGAALLSMQLYAGNARLDSWPIAVHPRFDRRLTHAPTIRQRMTVIVERASGEPTIDLGKGLENLGRARSVRLLQQLRSMAWRATTEAESAVAERGLIDLLAQSGVVLEAGDRVSILRQKWQLFPLDQREGLQTTVLKRYEVTDELGLGPQTDRWKKKVKKKIKMKMKIKMKAKS
ncbi:MAG TPA: HTTM domain-containing protein [Polyangiales bacterium]|nr:HTTM domain-containing protein [Polyangiales bacterium]